MCSFCIVPYTRCGLQFCAIVLTLLIPVIDLTHHSDCISSITSSPAAHSLHTKLLQIPAHA